MPTLPVTSAKLQRGFTLIEVMVALMIFALAISFLTTGIRATVSQSVYTKDRKLGHYVAQYVLTKQQIQALQASFSSSNLQLNNQSENTDIQMFDRNWQVNVKSQPEPLYYFADEDGQFFDRITVEVFDNEGRSVALLQQLQANANEP